MPLNLRPVFGHQPRIWIHLSPLTSSRGTLKLLRFFCSITNCILSLNNYRLLFFPEALETVAPRSSHSDLFEPFQSFFLELSVRSNDLVLPMDSDSTFMLLLLDLSAVAVIPQIIVWSYSDWKTNLASQSTWEPEFYLSECFLRFINMCWWRAEHPKVPILALCLSLYISPPGQMIQSWS